ncbi:hypothetical protein Ddye_017913 [Dipteronia dyeriana]|uniref:Uncharacterized protein n=1 Tax=Dipteronia dyeriana TaxID=168575 RepID=A0AAD9UA51_9ROSI|nr:hypothetical protein Ddye_017913 [Dipteronia dyeriana]
MSRRSERRKVAKNGKEKVIAPCYPEVEDERPSTLVSQHVGHGGLKFFSMLVEFTRYWARKCDASMAALLTSRCANLHKLRFRGADFADAIIHIQARKLREISGDYFRKITDAPLSVIAACHEEL